MEWVDELISPYAICLSYSLYKQILCLVLEKYDLAYIALRNTPQF